MLLNYILILILIFITIIIIRAIKFNPLEEKESSKFDMELDDENIVQSFVQMIRCKTVSYKDVELEDEKEFSKFKELLLEKYPNVNLQCQLYNIDRTGLLYHWKGESAEKPVVFMAHYDVVPVREEDWDKDPFSGIIEDGVIWGRGTLDTKATLCGIMEAAEMLISQGFKPENDIYLCFSGDEETNGPSTPSIVNFLEEKGIKPYMVLDEGGAIVQGVMPGVKGKCALIGTGEKGKMHIRLSYRSQGGHASSPPAIGPIGRLAKAVRRIESKPFNYHLSEPAKDMFNIVGRHSTFGLKIVFANINLFKPILDLLTRRTGGELNALVRTTTAFTMMEGSDAVNVIPPYASVEGDVRIMQGDTIESILEGYKKRINDENILIESLDYIPVAGFSSINTEPWLVLKKGIKEIWPDVIVSPYLMIACSDSRHFAKICPNVFRFSAMELTNEERKLIHGNNERIQVERLTTTVKFYLNIIQKF